MMEMYKEDCEMFGVKIPECFDGHRAVRALMELPSVTHKSESKSKHHRTCLECSHSMSADDESGNPILVCSEQGYKAVREEDTCWGWG